MTICLRKHLQSLYLFGEEAMRFRANEGKNLRYWKKAFLLAQYGEISRAAFHEKNLQLKAALKAWPHRPPARDTAATDSRPERSGAGIRRYGQSVVSPAFRKRTAYEHVRKCMRRKALAWNFGAIKSRVGRLTHKRVGSWISCFQAMV